MKPCNQGAFYGSACLCICGINAANSCVHSLNNYADVFQLGYLLQKKKHGATQHVEDIFLHALS
jgi:hypothetical protein